MIVLSFYFKSEWLKSVSIQLDYSPFAGCHGILFSSRLFRSMEFRIYSVYNETVGAEKTIKKQDYEKFRGANTKKIENDIQSRG